MNKETKTFQASSCKSEIITELETLLTEKLFDKFYPLILDPAGGFRCNLDYKWDFIDPQDRMIVTQARHTWTAVKAHQFYPNNPKYTQAAVHGYKFIRNGFWDDKFGGFYTMRNAKGGLSDYRGFYNEKRTYGNAFAVYSLAAVYELTKNKDVLDFAITAFDWIETHARDMEGRGYFQFLTREGKPFGMQEILKTRAIDANEALYKDQNSSIHLLEAYTELFKLWPDETLKSRLYELLVLIRDTITTPKGYMHLFFDHNWNPVLFRDADEETRKKNFRLDHVSFGHDYETAFLLLEASYALGLKNDVKTLRTAKKMVDHAIENGWDEELGGFWDGGYYFKDSNSCSIVHPVKNWWSQAEGLNALLLMYRIFPEEKKYFDHFVKLLNYINEYFIDHEFGGWYEGGIDKQPEKKYSLKGHIWKACYHEGRSIMNCIKMLTDKNYELYKSNSQFSATKDETEKFIHNWNLTAKNI